MFISFSCDINIAKQYLILFLEVACRVEKRDEGANWFCLVIMATGGILKFTIRKQAGFALLELLIFAAILPPALLVASRASDVVAKTSQFFKSNNTKSSLNVIKAYLVTRASNPEADGVFGLLKDASGGSGGALPGSLPLNSSDEWGASYRYCNWDTGVANTMNPSFSQNITGAPGGGIIGQVISAGKDKVFQTSCGGGAALGDDIQVNIYNSDVLSSNGNIGGWTDSGSNVTLLNPSDNLGLGVAAPTHKLELAAGLTAAEGIALGDVEIYRSAANTLALANGESFNLVSGSIQMGGSTVIDSTRNITAQNIDGNNLTLNGGFVSMANATSNMVIMGAAGVGAPTTVTRSAGTKLVLYPQVGAGSADYAHGVDANAMWSSVPAFSSSYAFRWYGGATSLMTLDGSGHLGVGAAPNALYSINAAMPINASALYVGGVLMPRTVAGTAAGQTLFWDGTQWTPTGGLSYASGTGAVNVAAGALQMGGVTVLNQTRDVVGINTVGQNLLPSANNLYSLGAIASQWANIFGTGLYQNGNKVADVFGSTIGYVPKFSDTNTLGNSLISDNGMTVTINGLAAVSASNPHLMFADTTPGAVNQSKARLFFYDNGFLFRALNDDLTIRQELMSIDQTGHITVYPNGTAKGLLYTDFTNFGGTIGRDTTIEGRLDLARVNPRIGFTDTDSSMTNNSKGEIIYHEDGFLFRGLNDDGTARQDLVLITQAGQITAYPNGVPKTVLYNDFSNTALALGVANGGTGVQTTPTNGQLLIGNGTGYSLATLAGTANQVVVTNSAGGITLSLPQGIATTSIPSFAGLSLTGNLALGANAITSGTWNGSTIAAGYGGTGISNYTIGDMLYASGAATLSKLAGVATGNVLMSGGVGAAPSWGKVGLTTHVSGVLPVANGGTGINGSTAANGQLLIGNGAGYSLGNITASNGLFVTNSSGVINVGLGLGATSTSGTQDWNDVSNTKPGSTPTLLMGNAANGSGVGAYFNPLNFEYSVAKDGTANVTQLAIPYTTSSAINSGLWLRGRYNGSWTGWKNILYSDLSNVSGSLPITNHAAGDYSSKITSGTYNINVTGNAGSAPLLSAVPYYNWLGATLPVAYNLGIQSSFVRASDGFPDYGSVMTMNTIANGGAALQLYTPYSPTYGGNALQVRFGNHDAADVWTAWKTILASDNFNTYTPTLTGTGASGTWGISVTGNAGTVANGVYTTGSYADPAWITSLAKSKVGLGNVENTALSTWAGTSNLTTLGTISTGIWNATTIAASKGGTGLISYAVGDILYASGAATLSRLAGVATGNVLISGGLGVAPSWGKVGLTTHVSGILPVANGGTGVNGSTAANGQLLIGNGTGFSLSNLTGTANQVVVTNSAGGVTLSLPQSIATTSTPTFGGMIVNGLSTIVNSNSCLTFVDTTPSVVNQSSGRLYFYDNGFLFRGLNDDLTARQELFSIGQTGNVAIGSASATRKLQIYGAHSGSEMQIFSSGDGASNTGILNLWASEPGTTYTGVGISNNIRNNDGVNAMVRENATRGGSYMRLLDNSISFATYDLNGARTVGVTFNGGGFVGIGTASPQGGLHITNSGNWWSGSNIGTNLIIQGNRNNALSIFDSTGSNPWAMVNYGGNLNFYPMPALGDTTTAVGNPKLSLTTAGKIGVGTGSPASALSITGGVAIGSYATTATAGNGSLIMSGGLGLWTDTPQGTLHINSEYGGTQWTPFAIGKNLIIQGNGNNGLSLFDNTRANPWAIYNYGGDIRISTMPALGDSVTSPGFEVTFKRSGNVGINTLTPASKFAVGGGVAIGTYAGTTAAPANGLLISGNVLIGTATDAGYKLRVNGTGYFDGALAASGGAWSSSDRRFKKDIVNVASTGNIMDKIRQLNGVYYHWRQAQFPERNFGGRRQVGVIAQDVEGIFPELVTTGPDGFKSVAYDKLSAVLIEGVKAQQNQLDEHDMQIKKNKEDIVAIRDKEIANLNQENSALKAKVSALEKFVSGWFQSTQVTPATR